MEVLRYVAVDRSNWRDLEQLFENKGGPHNCWCMVWRNMVKGGDRSNKMDKKASLKSYVDNGLPIGLLCYRHSEPIAWCSVAPRNSYRELHGESTIQGVWSLVCFFIKKEYRETGIVQLLIHEAEKYAGKNGAQYLEAYPVDAGSPSYRFMGYKSTFEKLGFNFRHKVGKRRNVMVKQLEQ